MMPLELRIKQAVTATHTQVLGLGGNLSEELDEVWQVISEEFGSNDEVLAGVVGLKLRAQQLGFALYPKC